MVWGVGAVNTAHKYRNSGGGGEKVSVPCQAGVHSTAHAFLTGHHQAPDTVLNTENRAVTKQRSLSFRCLILREAVKLKDNSIDLVFLPVSSKTAPKIPGILKEMSGFLY